jgi:hypothetical protein
MNTQIVAKFDKQKIKNEIQKLIRRLAEMKRISESTYYSPQSEELRRIRERNMYLRDEMIRRNYL